MTKSLFIRGMTCPRKLFYVGKEEYADNSLDDDFLESLAEGGIQVGALARCYFPGGESLAGIDTATARARTSELLASQKQVTIFEAAIQHGSLLFRADILVKDGDMLELIEVKAKSYDQSDSDGFRQKRGGGIVSDWKPYLFDVAFQKHVLGLAFPKATVRAFLMLADKRAKATVDGLNQKFLVKDEHGRKNVAIQGESTLAAMGAPILVKVPVDDVLGMLTANAQDTGGKPFAEYIDWLAGNYDGDCMIDWPVGVQCRDCEFRASEEQRANGLRSGFCECWHEQWGLSVQELEEPNVFDIWNYRRKAELLARRVFFLKDVTEEDIRASGNQGAKLGLAPSERQWMQVEKARNDDTSCYFDHKGYSAEASTWRYPLHFIDFETSAVAIPFNRGRHPYEGVAFQFSHHVVHEDGRIEHAGEYLNARPGVFPSYEFVRELKAQLEKDDGTIFRYAAHENTYLNMIHAQLLDEPTSAVPDREEICEWIRTITKSTGNSASKWEGPRNMVDMRELVLRYYYDPRTRGSNSIKAVLPAALNASAFLQGKYAQPIYGAKGGVSSLNYKDWTWVRRDAAGLVTDPYKLLPDVSGLTEEQLERLSQEGTALADGAAAMMAYARLQFSEVGDEERRNLEKALLRYCELDTFAMVMIWEHWADMIRPRS